MNPNNHKVYAGNHEPSATNVACFVSVIDESTPTHPYKFIDMAANQCVQGIDVDPGLNTVNGTTHFGEKMWTFDSATDTVALLGRHPRAVRCVHRQPAAGSAVHDSDRLDHPHARPQHRPGESPRV